MSQWINLRLAIDKFQKIHIASISPHEFIMCGMTLSNRYSVLDDKFFRYNIKNNSFNKLDIDNKNWHCANMVFNKEEKVLYIHNGVHIKCTNIITNVSKTFENVQDGLYLLFITNCFHVITRDDKDNIKHWIGAIENDFLNILGNTFNNNDSSNFVLGGKAIYIASKACIVLIGGHYRYCEDDDALQNEIWKYKLQTKKWTKCKDIVFDGYNFEAVLTSNEKHIILMGGVKYSTIDDGGDVETNDIFVLDMKDNDNWKIKQCKIKCPGVVHVLEQEQKELIQRVIY